MGQWTWPICDACWTEQNPERPPARFREAASVSETCGWCGKPTESGIYVREDPQRVPYAK